MDRSPKNLMIKFHKAKMKSQRAIQLAQQHVLKPLILPWNDCATLWSVIWAKKFTVLSSLSLAFSMRSTEKSPASPPLPSSPSLIHIKIYPPLNTLTSIWNSLLFTLPNTKQIFTVWKRKASLKKKKQKPKPGNFYNLLSSSMLIFKTYDAFMNSSTAVLCDQLQLWSVKY